MTATNNFDREVLIGSYLNNYKFSKFPERKAEFLVAFNETGKESKACETIKEFRMTIYNWRKVDPEFLRAFEDIQANWENEDLAKAKQLMDSFIDGTVEMKMPQAVLLMFKIKKLDPSYRENYKVEHGVSKELKELIERATGLQKAV